MAGEMTNLLMGIFLIAIVATGTGIFIGGLTNAYPTTATNVSDDNFTFFNKASTLEANMSDLATSLQTQQSQPESFLETAYNVMAGAFGVIMKLFGVGDLLIGLVGGFGIIAASIGIQLDWVIGIIYAIIITLVTVLIFRAVLKWEL